MEGPLYNANFSEHPIYVLSTHDSYGPTTGSLITQGGLGIKQSAHIGEQLTVNSVNITPSLGDIAYERQETLSNNITIPTPITNFIFYNDVTVSFKAIISVDISGSVNKNTLWEIDGTLKNSGWQINTKFTGDITGVRFYISNDTIDSREIGQINYTNSDNDESITVIRFRAKTLSPSGASNDAQTYATLPAVLEAVSIDYTPVINNWASPVPESLQQATDILASRLVNLNFAYEYHVSKSGNDSGNGSQERPYLTIQAAIDAINASSVPNSQTINIYVHPGNYTEPITLSRPNIGLIGVSSGTSNTCRLSCNIIINGSIDAGGSFNTIYNIENFLILGTISGNIIEYIGNVGGYLYLSKCKIYTSRIGQKLLVFSNTGDIKVKIKECEFSSTTSTINAACISTSNGCRITGYMLNSFIYGNTATALILGSSSVLTILDSTIDAASDNLIELSGTAGAFFKNCLLTNSKLNSNGIVLSQAAQLSLTYTTINIPTGSTYNPLNPTPPPATTIGYAVVGTSNNIFAYSYVSFVPLVNLSGTYYWTTNRISSSITNKFEYTTTFTVQ